MTKSESPVWVKCEGDFSAALNFVVSTPLLHEEPNSSLLNLLSNFICLDWNFVKTILV